MESQRISFDNFTRQIEQTVGQKLTLPASEAAEDFWNHWESVTELIAQRQLTARVSPLFLAHHYPQYRRYHTWRGGSILVLIAGLAVVWLSWPIGVVLLLGGFGLWLNGNRVRFNDAQAFAKEVMAGAKLSASDGGYARLCANYIAGIIELATPQASAHWPQHPSNVITGVLTFIDTAQHD